MMTCSIVIPTYNRKKFEKLIEYNIKRQTYYKIKEVIILDDGDDEMLNLNIPYKIVYLKNLPRCTIGYKRNLGCELSTSEYIAFMDTDDYYDDNYISHSIFKLSTTDYQVCGQADMLMYHKDTNQFYQQSCMFIHLFNEATLVFKRKYWLENKFSETSSGEAVGFLSNHCECLFEVKPQMVCIIHDTNTISKDHWLKEQYKIKPVMDLAKILYSLNI